MSNNQNDINNIGNNRDVFVDNNNQVFLEQNDMVVPTPIKVDSILNSKENLVVNSNDVYDIEKRSVRSGTTNLYGEIDDYDTNSDDYRKGSFWKWFLIGLSVFVFIFVCVVVVKAFY